MFARLIVATAQLLRFRAGPQDFPFARGLSLPIAAVAALANFVQFRFTTPPAVALAEGIAVVLVTIAYAQLALQFKKLQNRSQQTINSLLATNIALTCLLIPLLVWLGPALKDFAENPQAVEQGRVPAGPIVLMFLLSLWSLAVSSNIFRHALDVGLFLGIGVALLMTVMMYTVVSSVGQLIGA